MKINFAKLRDSGEWGLRGSKESASDVTPAEGSTVTVTKKGGDKVKRTMGRVVAEGDDWWLATCGFKKDTTPPGRRNDWGADAVEVATVTALTEAEREENAAEDAARWEDRNEALDRDATLSPGELLPEDEEFDWGESD